MKFRSVLLALSALLMLGVGTAYGSEPAFTGSFPGFCLPGMICSDPASNSSLPGQWTQGSYSGRAGSRNYYLYVPKKTNGQALPLMVMLHGCFQDPVSFANETGMNVVAEKYGFAVLYPEQTFQDNIWKCWNWFKPENQTRNGGELGIVIGMIGQVSKSVSIDTRRIYAAGLSAGAAMASNLVACHSDIFSGAGIASGYEYKAATSEAEAHQIASGGSTHDLRAVAADAVKCTGKGARMVSIVSVQGQSDPYVGPANADRVVEMFTKMNDLIDDGKENGSQNMSVIARRNEQVPNGYRYTSEFFGGQGSVRIQKISVEGMGHAWSGAYQSGQYADTKGPNAAETIWLFLSNYSIKQ